MIEITPAGPIEPEHIIAARNRGEVPTEVMMNFLRDYEYTFGYCPTVNGHETDAYVSGTWDQVRRAFYTRAITDKEMYELMDIQIDKKG